MSDYSKLVKALRCKRDDCEGCDLAFFDKDEGWMCQYAAKDDDAAAAIEDMSAQLADKDYLIQQQKYEIQRLMADVKRQQEKMFELAKKLPKRGEWIGVSPMVDTVQCSVCGGQLFSEELETPYCPYCGAKMEVQDGQE